MRARTTALILAVAIGSMGSIVASGTPAGPLLRTSERTSQVIGKLPTAARALRHTVDRIPREQLLREGPKPGAAPPAPGQGLIAFEGLSTWIDTYDTGLSAQQQVAIAAGSGVDTLFVQVSRISTDGFIHDHDRLAATIEGAHDAGMTVMVWTIPTFEDLEEDEARARAAMAFVTPRGDRPDAFGLDIEAQRVADVPERTSRLLLLSQRLRTWVGPDYPMSAIVLPPRQLEINTSWWPGFPYADLVESYDVFIPMSYSSYRGTDAVTTLAWNRDNVVLVRQLAGDPALPVHLAGGIADNLPEVAAFVQAAAEAGVMGAGLYDLHTTPPEAWSVLQALRRPVAIGQ